MSGDEYKNKYKFTWEIENYSFSPLWRSTGLRSPLFTADSLNKTSWYLQLDYYSRLSRSECTVSLKRYDIERTFDIKITWSVEIIDQRGENVPINKFKNIREVFKNKGFGRWGYFINDEKNLKDFPNETLTIKCRFSSYSPNKRSPNGSSILSKLCVDQTSFIWRAKCWSGSAKISLPEATQLQMTLDAPDDDVEIKLKIIESKRSIPFLYSTALLDTDGHERYLERVYCCFMPEEREKNILFLKKSYLLSKETNYIIDGHLNLSCQLFYARQILNSELKERTCETFGTLRDDILRMYRDRIQTDVKLRTDGETFASHKCILSTRSPVFSAMFQQDMTESQTGIVEIADMDAKTMNSMLVFMYSGGLENLDYENASKLVLAAEKYEIISLKETCCLFLNSILSEENVCEILALADMVNHPSLKDSAIEYVKTHAAKVLLSDTWNESIVRNVRLATEVLSKLSINYGIQAGKLGTP